MAEHTRIPQDELIEDIRSNLRQLANTPKGKDVRPLENRTTGLISSIQDAKLRRSYGIFYEGAVNAHQQGKPEIYNLP